MINFNKLQITSSGENLIIDVSIDETNQIWSNNVVIKAIYIETEQSISDYSKPQDEHIVWSSVEGVKNFKDTFYANVIGSSTFNDKLIYVWVKINNNTAAANGAPCDMSKEYYVGMVYNQQQVVDAVIPIIKQSKCICKPQIDCSDNSLLVEFILKKQAIDYAIQAGELKQAGIFWSLFFGKYLQTKINNSKCNCHG